MSGFRVTRRRLLGSLASVLAALSRAGAGENPPRDRGIGGTGAVLELDGSDRGIGGTGVIGTIRRFGSIYVNGMRISYPADVQVEIDGVAADAAQLRIGQVVQVVATQSRAGLETQKIKVTSEVVGPVERVSGDHVVVLGQTIATTQIETGHWQPGGWVAVSGLRRNDGTIVASLMRPVGAGAMRVAGPVRLGADGAAMIGGLAVAALPAAFVGRRVLVTGAFSDGAFVAREIAEPDRRLLAQVRSLSIESYFSREGSHLQLGSGLVVETGGQTNKPSGYAIVTARVDANGLLRAERLTAPPARAPGEKTGPHGSNSPAQGGRGGPSGGLPDRPGLSGERGKSDLFGGRPAGGADPFGGPAPNSLPGLPGNGNPPQSAFPPAPNGFSNPGGFTAPGGFGGPGGPGGPGGFGGPGGPGGPGGMMGPGGPPRR
jgi:hypothetical protein